MNWSERLASMDKEAFGELIEHIISNIGVQQVAISQDMLSKPGYCETSTAYRLDIVLSGKKHILYPHAGHTVDALLSPGDVILAPPGTGKIPLWDTFHEMSSIVFEKNFIRMTYICVNHPVQTLGIKASYFYHTSNAAGETCQRLLSLIECEGHQKGHEKLLQALVKALLLKLHEEILNDHPQTFGKSEATWRHLRDYVKVNATQDISRTEVAKALQLNPSYVTFLFRKYTGKSFEKIIREYRLETAERLLTLTSDSIDSIASQCGYQSCTTFIAVFKKRYGMPPGHYRSHCQALHPTPSI